MTAPRSCGLSRVRMLAALSLAYVAACSDRPGSAEEGAAPVTVAPSAVLPPAPPCRPQPSGRILSGFTAGACGATLAIDERGLGLWDLATRDADPPARGPAPEPCAKGDCDYFGYDSAVGPVIVARLRSLRSGMPGGVWLGVALDPARRQLVFFDLWAGGADSVVGDGTDLGPAHSLAPFACGAGLGLFAVGRIAAARGVEAPALLRLHEGVYAWGETAPVRANGEREACTPIDVELP